MNTVAEECDGDQQYLHQSAHVLEAIVRQTWKGWLLWTTTNGGKRHDVTRSRGTQTVHESSGIILYGLLATSPAAI